MATFGEIRFRLQKTYPGADLALLDGWINDRYAALLDKLSWQRIEKTAVLQTTAEYAAGTVAIAQGATALTGTGTTWTAAMTGRTIRIVAAAAHYEFTYASATTGTLSRPYEGATVTAGSYRINQRIYSLPQDLRMIASVGDLHRKSMAELNEIAGADRNSYGEPVYWAPAMDAATDPPVPRIELFPIPIAVQGYPYHYTGDPAGSTTLLPWLRPAAILAGVQADICSTPAFRDLAAAARFEAQFGERAAELVRMEAERIGPQRIRTEPSWGRHRVRRWTR